MNVMPESDSNADDAEPTAPTQEQLYDDLRRIGQLEDKKHTIQSEIQERTERLRAALPTLDKNSLLYQMLTSALKPAATQATARSAPKKKTVGKKKARR